ncbi:radial spokehead protein (macronuclear) [Tetrahymena thermophila SB210]|uniref:Radial spokehead protein n=1 Tax=Tetrahymena thermophila (strain SB210) TaxID=312017 RepID=I7M9L5_TETTS|nr:radial spokehead protein [Tetrahymena thermophila SB210]EAS02067.3 radial spokehead protein [Tetrahymena thermophila SB210]|eukprot:XP_001022312.3 radial spokehead protein [Tetrahymena thermophila SB210]
MSSQASQQNIENLDQVVYNQITEYIKQQKEEFNNIDLYEHLYRVFHKLIREPNKFCKDLDHFNLISDFIKKNSFNYKCPLSDSEVNNIPLKIAEHQEWISKSEELFKDFSKLSLNRQKLLIQNFYEDSLLLETAGIGFSEEESFKISQSIRRLADQYQATSMRFWGKYLTRGKDYYVAQGLYSNENCDKLPDNCEQKGQGVNRYTFWVTHNVLEEWTELPLIHPDHIVQARQIKYLLTGDLNASLKTYPLFYGKEKHFLKAQLVRITFGSELAPKGLYRPPEEGENDIQLEDEPFKLPEYTELQELSTWVHMHPPLLKQGRTTIYVDPKLPEEEREAKLAELQEQDQDTQIERLRDISQDKSPFALPEGEGGNEEEETNWQKREYGDKQQFNTIEGDTVVNYNCVSFKNLTWPGAHLVVNSQSYCNIYVGYGLKQNQHPFLPVEPSDMLEEQEDTDEHPEPNPNNPPDEVESDSDDEKKEEDEEEN